MNASLRASCYFSSLTALTTLRALLLEESQHSGHKEITYMDRKSLYSCVWPALILARELHLENHTDEFVDFVLLSNWMKGIVHTRAACWWKMRMSNETNLQLLDVLLFPLLCFLPHTQQKVTWGRILGHRLPEDLEQAFRVCFSVKQLPDQCSHRCWAEVWVLCPEDQHQTSGSTLYCCHDYTTTCPGILTPHIQSFSETRLFFLFLS